MTTACKVKPMTTATKVSTPAETYVASFSVEALTLPVAGETV